MHSLFDRPSVTRCFYGCVPRKIIHALTAFARIALVCDDGWEQACVPRSPQRSVPQVSTTISRTVAVEVTRHCRVHAELADPEAFSAPQLGVQRPGVFVLIMHDVFYILYHIKELRGSRALHLSARQLVCRRYYIYVPHQTPMDVFDILLIFLVFIACKYRSFGRLPRFAQYCMEVHTR